MKKSTNRDIEKATQLQHIKQKLHDLKNTTKSRKKDSLVKNLKNLMKRAVRKGTYK